MTSWQTEADYRYSLSLTWHEWAWEFLRRSSAYRLAWAEFVAAAVVDRAALQVMINARFNLDLPVDPDLSVADWHACLGQRALPWTRTPWNSEPRVLLPGDPIPTPVVEHRGQVVYHKMTVCFDLT